MCQVLYMVSEDIWGWCGREVRVQSAGAGAGYVRGKFCPHSVVWYIQQKFILAIDRCEMSTKIS